MAPTASKPGDSGRGDSGRGEMGLAEISLWSIAAFCFLALAGVSLASLASARTANAILAEPHQAAETLQQAQSHFSGEVIGRLEIPALHLTVPMTAGVENSSLLQGVGHVNGTAQPGGLGTIALAGHRDTYLRPLENIAKKMDIRVIDNSGAYHYEVDSWEVVSPDDVSVLLIRSRPELVLITCYPFHFIGPAPKRFVVHAHLVSLTPDA